MTSKAIGIDFGTSNSTVGYSGADGTKLIDLENSKQAIPSAIFYDTEKNQTLFGNEAISAYIDHCDGRLLRALKTILGSSLINEKTLVGGARRSFKSIIGDYLGHLKGVAEIQRDDFIGKVVIGRPVFFVDEDVDADRSAQCELEEAAISVGFEHVEFQYEPIAAALDYERTVVREELALIADIGGGTSDFSIVRVSPARHANPDRQDDILANTGVHIGGTNLDTRLSLEQVMPLLGYHTRQRARAELDLPSFHYRDLATWHRIMMLYTNKTRAALETMRYEAQQPELVDRFIKIVKNYDGHRLASDVEAAKVLLSKSKEAALDLTYIEPGLTHAVRRDVFEQTAHDEMDKIARALKECLSLAQIAPSMIDTLFLTGGTTSVPAVLSVCKAAVPSACVVEGDKPRSVGIGLAIDAAIRFG